LLYVAALRLLASLVFHLGHRALPASPVSQLSQKLRLFRNPPGVFLGLQRRPLQLVDRPRVHDVGHLDVLQLLVSFSFHRRLKAGNFSNVRGANMGGVPEIGRLSDHVPADLWPLPVGLRLLLHDTGAEEVDPELASHGGGRGFTGPS